MRHSKPFGVMSALLAVGAFASAGSQPASNPIVQPEEIAAGPFKPTDESLAAYRCPEWFRDAKFGIWSHWGPQAVPREGDWYAKGLYEHGTSDGEGGARLKQNRYNK